MQCLSTEPTCLSTKLVRVVWPCGEVLSLVGTPSGLHGGRLHLREVLTMSSKTLSWCTDALVLYPFHKLEFCDTFLGNPHQTITLAGCFSLNCSNHFWSFSRTSRIDSIVYRWTSYISHLWRGMNDKLHQLTTSRGAFSFFIFLKWEAKVCRLYLRYALSLLSSEIRQENEHAFISFHKTLNIAKRKKFLKLRFFTVLIVAVWTNFEQPFQGLSSIP